MLRSEAAAFAVALLACLGAPDAIAGGDGRMLYARCAACHGPAAEGVPSTGAPPLAGLDPDYVQRQLAAFASGARGARPGDRYGATMRAAGAPLLGSDAERATVARYVAGLPRPARHAPATTNANGRNYFNAVCGACHGGGGEGNPALGAPRLAGQPASYLARQFEAFRSGQRGYQANDRFGAQMRAVTTMLPDAAAVRDVVMYAASLQP